MKLRPYQAEAVNAIASLPTCRYNSSQALVTPAQAAPRSVIAAFLCPIGFAPMGDAPRRKAGGPTCVGLRTSPTNAFVSVEKVSTRSDLLMNTPAIATPDLPPAQDAKRCTKCGEEKHLSEFGIDNKRQDKLNYNCKPCCRKAAEAYRSKYGISVNQRVSLWKKSHPTEIKKSSDKYYARNKQKIKAYSASKYLENPDIFKQRVFAYRQANPEKSKEFCRAWSRANPEKNAARHSKRRAQKLASVGQHTAADIKKLIVLQKNKCAVCCISIKDGYHVDHVIPLIAGGGNGKDNIQLLCPPCNRKKGSKHPVDFMQSQGKLL